jgi:hypothetical protein
MMEIVGKMLKVDKLLKLLLYLLLIMECKIKKLSPPKELWKMGYLLPLLFRSMIFQMELRKSEKSKMMAKVTL